MQNVANLLLPGNFPVDLGDVSIGKIDEGPFDGGTVGDGLQRVTRFIIFLELKVTAESKT